MLATLVNCQQVLFEYLSLFAGCFSRCNRQEEQQKKEGWLRILRLWSFQSCMSILSCPIYTAFALYKFLSFTTSFSWEETTHCSFAADFPSWMPLLTFRAKTQYNIERKKLAFNYLENFTSIVWRIILSITIYQAWELPAILNYNTLLR